jgi:hypothetical protein
VRINKVPVAAAAAAALAAGLSLPAMTMAAAAGGRHDHVLPSAAVQHSDVAVVGAHYARFERVCPSARRGGFTCFAVRRVPMSLRTGERIPTGVHPYAGGAGPAGGYAPSDLEALYNFDRTHGSGGSGQTVGIVDWFNDSTITNDINTFDSQYGFPQETSSTFSVVNEHGHASPLPTTDASTSDGSVETSLDVEAVRAACENCRIVLVEANGDPVNGPSDTDLADAENTAVAQGADVVSNSYGGPELYQGQRTFSAAYENAYNHHGVAILASTGDDGWYDWDTANVGQQPYGAANQPADFPGVIAVGGTKVGSTSTGKRSETVWNENGNSDKLGGNDGENYGASGGGCSRLIKAMPWQKGVAGYGKTGCGKFRLNADIAAIADPATGFDIYDTDIAPTDWPANGWGTIGGTSLASPFVAGMWALAGGPQGVKNPTATLYANFAKHSSSLNDVTQGGNAFCGGASPSSCKSYWSENPNELVGARVDCHWTASGKSVSAVSQCVAGKGFDGPSGVGTPNGLTVFKPRALTLSIAAPSRIVKGKKTVLSAVVKDPVPGDKGSTYRWTIGSTGSGSGKSLSHTFGRSGEISVTLRVVDNAGLKGTVTKTVKVG